MRALYQFLYTSSVSLSHWIWLKRTCSMSPHTSFLLTGWCVVTFWEAHTTVVDGSPRSSAWRWNPAAIRKSESGLVRQRLSNPCASHYSQSTINLREKDCCKRPGISHLQFRRLPFYPHSWLLDLYSRQTSFLQVSLYGVASHQNVATTAAIQQRSHPKAQTHTNTTSPIPKLRWLTTSQSSAFIRSRRYFRRCKGHQEAMRSTARMWWPTCFLHELHNTFFCGW